MRPLLLLSLFGCRTAMVAEVDDVPSTVWTDYDALLAEVVTDEGLVDYAALAERRGPLDRLVASLSDGRLYGKINERGATWINAYNAFVLFALLEEGPPASVLDVGGWVPVDGAGFYLERTFAIDANQYSLWEIEQERIRLRRQDYRTHAVLGRGTMSSPPLKAGIYEADTLELEMNARMRAWVNDPVRGVRVEGGEVLFSPMFSWYADDFWRYGGEYSLCILLASYAEPPLRQSLVDHERRGCPVRTFAYDWSLNDASTLTRGESPPTR